MSAHPEIVIALLKGDLPEFLDGHLIDEATFRELLAHKPAAFSVARVNAGGMADHTYALLRRNIIKWIAKPEVWNRARVHIFNFTELRPEFDDVVAPKNDSVVWISDSFGDEQLDRLIDYLVAPPEPLPSIAVATSKGLDSPMEAGRKHRERLLREEQWYSSEQVHALVRGGSKATNVSQTAAELRKKHRIVGVSVAGQYMHPAVQFDLDEGRVLSAMPKLLEIIPGDMSEWAIVNWLFQRRKSLRGKRPADVLAADPAAVLQSARDDFEPSASTW